MFRRLKKKSERNSSASLRAEASRSVAHLRVINESDSSTTGKRDKRRKRRRGKRGTDADADRPSTSAAQPETKKSDAGQEGKRAEDADNADDELSDTDESEVFVQQQKFWVASGTSLNKSRSSAAQEEKEREERPAERASEAGQPKPAGGPRLSQGTTSEENANARTRSHSNRKCFDFYTFCFVSLMFLPGILYALSK